VKVNLPVRGNVVSAVLAAVIFAIIAAATGAGAGFVIIGAVLIGAVTFLISYLIARAVQARRGRA
jgi:hydrogenase-4 membrane subunit HyfE